MISFSIPRQLSAAPHPTIAGHSYDVAGHQRLAYSENGGGLFAGVRIKYQSALTDPRD